MADSATQLLIDSTDYMTPQQRADWRDKALQLLLEREAWREGQLSRQVAMMRAVADAQRSSVTITVDGLGD